MRSLGRASKARRARPRRRVQPFAAASASASRDRSASAASRASARSRSRSVGAVSIGQVSVGERAPAGRALDLLGREQRGRVVPERARLERRAVVGRRLADEIEPSRRPRAGGVEEVAVAADRVGPLEPRARARGGGRRRGTASRCRAAAGRPPRARARRPSSKRRVRAREEVEHGDPSGLARRRPGSLEPGERVEQLVAAERPPTASSAVELVEQLGQPPRSERRSRRGCVAGRRRLEAVGGPHHRLERARGRRRAATAASRSSRSATSGASRSRSVSSSTRAGASTARPRSRPSTKSTLGRAIPEYGERRKP